jgi:hypothetical protein
MGSLCYLRNRADSVWFLCCDADRFSCARFEMILSAFEYESQQPQLDLSEFYSSTEGKFRTPEIKPLVAELEERRKAMLASRGSSRQPAE